MSYSNIWKEKESTTLRLVNTTTTSDTSKEFSFNQLDDRGALVFH